MTEKQHLPEREAAVLAEKPKGRLYPEVSRELKNAIISDDVRRKADALAQDVDRINLNDIAAVKERTEAYLRSCADSATIPSVMGLAAIGFGCSRQWLNEFCRTHKGSPSADYIEQVKDVFADALCNAALNRAASEAISIFILKNTAGFSDRVEITPGSPDNPLGVEPDQAALESKLGDVVIEDIGDDI